MIRARRAWPVGAVMLAAVAPGGCATEQLPAPVEYRDQATAPVPSQRPLAQARRPADKPAVIVIDEGETLYAVARRHETSVRDLIERNRLEPPYKLRAGERLRLPPADRHVVRRGETLYGISRAYDVTTTELARLNGPEPPYRLLVGQRLVIPSRPDGRAAPPQAEPVVGRAPAPEPPGAARPAPPAPASGQARFDWPVRGAVLSRFGAKQGGLHNDGINIATTPGAEVRAADDGVVAYAGNELKGFGNLVLIRHQGGYTTAYAHNARLLVKRGDQVRRGQVIARAGRSGNVSRAQLHFEIRKGTRAIDPITLLPRLTT